MKRAAKWIVACSAILVCAVNIGSLIWNNQVQSELSILDSESGRCGNPSCRVELFQEKALIKEQLRTSPQFPVVLQRTMGEW